MKQIFNYAVYYMTAAEHIICTWTNYYKLGLVLFFNTTYIKKFRLFYKESSTTQLLNIILNVHAYKKR